MRWYLGDWVNCILDDTTIEINHASFLNIQEKLKTICPQAGGHKRTFQKKRRTKKFNRSRHSKLAFIRNDLK